MAEKDNKFVNIADTLRRIATLYIENAKLSTAEKLTVLLSGIAICALVMVLGLLALVFIAIGISALLSEFIAPFWSYFIIAGLFILIAGIIIMLKEPLVLNPVARFISRLFVDQPKSQKK